MILCKNVSPIIFIKDNSRIQKNEENDVATALFLYYLEFPFLEK